MKILGITFGKEKAVSFHQFRDVVRLSARRNHPGATIVNTENGFNLTLDGKMQTCNLRGLYATYYKNPKERELLIKNYLDTLVVEVPAHSWSEAIPLLRPTLKSTAFLEAAEKGLRKQKQPDSIPSRPFVGDLNVIAVVQLPGQVAAVTQNLLDGWGVTLDEAMRNALNNMGMANFPDVNNALVAGGSAKKGEPQEEVGLVFEGDHMTATWLISERFRDYVGQRLQGSFIVAVPSRSKLTAVRADEPGLISSIQTSNRNFQNQPYALTGQLFHVSASTTGGLVTVYTPGGKGEALEQESMFAAGQSKALPSISHAAAGTAPAGGAKDLNTWFGINEPTEEAPTGPPPQIKRGGGKR